MANIKKKCIHFLKNTRSFLLNHRLLLWFENSCLNTRSHKDKFILASVPPPFLPSSLLLSLCEWMGSCIQGPGSCNEQDGVQSLFHQLSLADTHRQMPSIGCVQSWQERFLWYFFFSPHSRKNCAGYNIVLLRKAFSCLRNLKYIRRATWWWRRGLVSLQITKIQDDWAFCDQKIKMSLNVCLKNKSLII